MELRHPSPDQDSGWTARHPPGAASSPEFDLILACLRWPATSADGAYLRELAQRPIRWPHLLEVARHHQVSSLVSHAIETWAPDCVSPEALAALRAAAVQNARLCFHNVSELANLAELFQERGIGLRILKGPPLAIFAFGDATLRGAGDLDLLVDDRELPEADELLRSRGYVRVEPAARLTPRRMRSYRACQKDFSYDHPRSGIAIDLHWRLFRNSRLPFNMSAAEASLAWVQLGKRRIPVLAWDDTFLYLSIHGALDGWLRAKWLADVGALINRFSAADLEAAVRRAAERGVLPEVSAAILLCRQRLGFTGAPAGCLEPGHPTVRRILHFANRLMSANDFRPVREQIPSSAWFTHELLLRSSFDYRKEMIHRSLFRPRVWQSIDLPDSLFALYGVLSPFEWVWFRLRRLARRTPAAPRRRTRSKPESGLAARFLALSPADAALLAEATALLLFFRIALRFFSVQRLTAWMGGRAAGELPDGVRRRQIIRRVEWAVGAIVRHAPWTFVCFPQSLTAYFMLRRRRVGSKLFYGVTREEKGLSAHTWIKVGERTVVGGEAEPRFTVLAIFP